LITGAADLGNSQVACALGHKACGENISVLYARVPRRFADLAVARGSPGYARLLRTLARVKPLILDDWGPEALNAGPRPARNRRGPIRLQYRNCRPASSKSARSGHQSARPWNVRSFRVLKSRSRAEEPQLAHLLDYNGH
jgi:hypothetical protein